MMDKLKSIFIPLIVLQMLMSPISLWPRNRFVATSQNQQDDIQDAASPLGPVDELKQFRKDVLGDAKFPETCGEAKLQSVRESMRNNPYGAPNFYEALNNMRNNPYGGHLTFTSTSNSNECEQTIVEGAIHRLPQEDIRPLYNRAMGLKIQVLYIISDTSYDREQRRMLFHTYIESVLFPMRALIVKKQSFTLETPDANYSYEYLLPERVPDDFICEIPNLQDPAATLLMTVAGLDNLCELPEGISYENNRTRFNILALKRDVQTLASSATTNQTEAQTTTDQYVQALQLQSILVSLRLLRDYDIISDTETKSEGLSVPQACYPYLNTDELFFPSTITEKTRKKFFLETLLTKHGFVPTTAFSGLTASQDESLGFSMNERKAFEHYNDVLNEKDVKSINETMDFPLGTSPTPFEEYSYAQKGLNNFESYPQYSELIPAISDNRDTFDRIRKIKEIENVASFLVDSPLTLTVKSILSYLGAIKPSLPSQYNGIQMLHKLFPFSEEEQTEFSPYLVESMERNNVADIMDLIPSSLEEELKSREVVFEMPSLYSPVVWQRWGFETLGYFTGEAQKVDKSLFQDIENAVTDTCRSINNLRTPVVWQYPVSQYVPGINRFCRGKSPRETLKNIHDFIESKKSEVQGLLLSSKINESELENYYPFFRRLWRFFNRHGSFHRVDMSEYMLDINEYNFLENQIFYFGNPWAVLRLGILLLMEEVKGSKIENNESLGLLGTPPRFNEFSLARRMLNPIPYQIQEFNKGIDIILERLQQAARVWGIDKPLSNEHAGKILTMEEKKSLWSDIIGEYNRDNDLLLSTEIGGESVHNYLMGLSYRYFFSKEDVIEYLEATPHVASIIGQESSRKLNEITLSYEEQMLSEIYKAKKAGRELNANQEEFIIQNPVDNARQILLELDTRFKLPILQSLLKQSSSLRREDIVEAIEEICSLNPREHGDRRAIFYGTLNIQNELNNMIGLPEVPEDILGEIDSMDPLEWNMLKAAGVLIGSVMSSVVAYSSSAACMGATGGACALLIPAIMSVAPWGAVTSQVYLFWGEWHLFFEAQRHSKQLKLLENLHFTDRESSGEVERSIFFPAIEVAGFYGVMGIAGRALNFLKQSLISVARNKNLNKNLLRTVYRRMEIELAQSLLGHGNYNRASQGMVNLRKRFRGLRNLYKRREISLDTLLDRIPPLLKSWSDDTFGEVSMKFSSIEEVDKSLAAKISAHFVDDPVKMADFLDSYLGRRLRKAQRWINPLTGEKIPFAQRPRSGRIPLIGRGVGWMRQRETVQNLVKQSQDIQSIRSDLLELSQTGENLETYIGRHAERLTNIFANLPYRKREFPHLFSLQGGYHHYLSHINYPPRTWGAVSDGVVMEAYFRSRARLVYEFNTKAARARFGLSPNVITESSLESMNHFSDAYLKALSKTSGEERRALEESYESFINGLTLRVFESPELAKLFKKGRAPDNLNLEDYRRILFNPRKGEEEIFSEKLWKSMNTESIFQLDAGKDFSNKIHQQLTNFNNPNEFQYYLSTLKVILTKSADPLIIDIF